MFEKWVIMLSTCHELVGNTLINIHSWMTVVGDS
jgi:hypothetical protein